MRSLPDLTRPATWPCKYLLPMIRRTLTGAERGVLLEEHGPIVYRADWRSVMLMPEKLVVRHF